MGGRCDRRHRLRRVPYRHGAAVAVGRRTHRSVHASARGQGVDGRAFGRRGADPPDRTGTPMADRGPAVLGGRGFPAGDAVVGAVVRAGPGRFPGRPSVLPGAAGATGLAVRAATRGCRGHGRGLRRAAGVVLAPTARRGHDRAGDALHRGARRDGVRRAAGPASDAVDRAGRGVLRGVRRDDRDRQVRTGANAHRGAWPCRSGGRMPRRWCSSRPVSSSAARLCPSARPAA